MCPAPRVVPLQPLGRFEFRLRLIAEEIDNSTDADESVRSPTGNVSHVVELLGPQSACCLSVSAVRPRLVPHAEPQAHDSWLLLSKSTGDAPVQLASGSASLFLASGAIVSRIDLPPGLSRQQAADGTAVPVGSLWEGPAPQVVEAQCSQQSTPLSIDAFASAHGRWAILACGYVHLGYFPNESTHATDLPDGQVLLQLPTVSEACTSPQLVLSASHVWLRRECGERAIVM